MCARSATCVTVSYVCVCAIHTGVQLLSILRSFFVLFLFFFFFRLFCFYLGWETRHLPPDGWEEWAKGLNQHPRALTWVWSRSRSSSSSSNNNSDSNHGTWSNHMPTTKHTKVASSPCRRIIRRLFFVYWEKKTQHKLYSFLWSYFSYSFYFTESRRALKITPTFIITVSTCFLACGFYSNFGRQG